MAKPRCESCRMRGVCRDSAASWVFFFVGVVATIALRVIGPIDSVNPLYGRISWYVGVAGFFVFFVYKYRVLNARSRLIRETGLVEKLASSSPLSGGEYALLAEIACSQDSWKERANFFVIFVLSAVALALALWVDLAR